MQHFKTFRCHNCFISKIKTEKMNFKFLFPLFLLAIISTSCTHKSDISTINTEEVPDTLSLSIRTAEEQAALSPDDVVSLLKKGNSEFSHDSLTILNTSQRIRDAINGQYPVAAVLSCSDSRIPVEDIFHMGIGDLFVARVAGNVVNEDIIGSLEYGCKVLGAKVIVVLGHEYCGAIKSAIDDVKLGNVTELLSKIQPAVALASKNYDGSKTTKNPQFVEKVCDANVDISIDDIRKRSSILSQLEAEGKLKIIGAVYDIKTGEVDFFDGSRFLN